MTEATRTECLQLVEQSPNAVAAHDKAAWLAIFASNCVVEDPVGSAPHSGAQNKVRLGDFYETFIASNTIRFHVDRDIVCGLHVVRDLTIEIAMSPRVTVRVPVHLLYELAFENGQLKISRLAAHWELWPMLKQQFNSGLRFLGVGTASALRMLHHLGVGGILGFTRALTSVGDSGKAQLALFARHFNEGQVDALKALFADEEPTIAFPFNKPQLSVASCVARGGELAFSKVIAAGEVVSATLIYRTSTAQHQGVVFASLERASLSIKEITFYWDE